MAQVAAEALGVDYKRIRVIHGQTDRIAYGIGAHASRATVMTASATHNAAVKLRGKALEYAAGMLQAPVDALAIVDGRVLRTDGGAGASISLGEIAEGLSPTSKTRGGREPGLSAEGWFDTKHQVYPYGTHVAVVRVDRETGGVTVERYIAGYDIGRAINPTLVKGQIAGGFAQGLGGALFEEFVYSERGDPLSATFADYLMPTARRRRRRSRSSSPRTPRPRSIRSASRARAKAASPPSAPRSPPRSRLRSACRARSRHCRSRRSGSSGSSMGSDMMKTIHPLRHGRACPGHPRLSSRPRRGCPA